ncbi:MAG: peptide-binding protein [Chloroflexota bacterium]|nr:MAG: peptide-binding protein [Chloroflexota bacterium]
MKKTIYKGGMLALLIAVLALTAAQCGAAPTVAPAPQEAQSTPVESAAEAQPATETAAEAEAVEENNSAATEAEPSVIDAENKLAEEVVGGSVFTTDEPDVSTPRTKLGGEYRTVSSSDAVSFHPYLTSDASSWEYQGLVYSSSLLEPDENTLEYKPYMAEKYEISEDGLTFTFYLRKDLKWSDGKPLTAQDFKWTYDQVVNPDNEYPYLSQIDFVESYEALDDYTIQAKIKQIHAPAIVNLAEFITPLPKHIWEKLDWSDPEKNPEINNPSVVSGPYKLVEWKRDQYAVFEANPNYWYHGSPNIQKYIIEIVPDQDVAFEKLKSGETDSSTMTPEQLQEARTLENVTVYEWWPAQSVWSYIGLNMREGFPTHDINIRHGLNYAIDKQLLTDEVWLGQARRLCTIYPPTTWAHNPDVPCYEYDPDKALAEFAEAGYTLKDDKLVNEKGEQLKLKFLYGPNTSPTAELIAVTIQGDLKKVGIEVEVEGLEWASFLEATEAENPSWDMFLGGWQSGIEPHSQATVWAEENIPELNAVAYVNKEMEELFEEAAATYDIGVRKEKYAAVQELIAEDSPYIIISYRKRASAQNDRVQGIIPTALGIGWNQEDWYIVDK